MPNVTEKGLSSRLCSPADGVDLLLSRIMRTGGDGMGARSGRQSQTTSAVVISCVVRSRGRLCGHFGHAALGGSGEGSAFFLGYTPRTPPSRLRVPRRPRRYQCGFARRQDHGHPGRVRMRQVDLAAARHRAFAAHAGAYLAGARSVRAPRTPVPAGAAALWRAVSGWGLLGSLTLAENVGVALHEHTRCRRLSVSVLRILDLVGACQSLPVGCLP